MNRSSAYIILKLLVLAGSITGICIGLVHKIEWLAWMIGIAMIIQLFDLFRFYKRITREVEDFAEAARYRDFSRNYNEKQASPELAPLRKGFNEINKTFKTVSREKEMQYQYLQKVLALIDTAIISYEHESGEINWMNESFTRLLDIPYLKTVHSLEKRYKELYGSIMAINTHDNTVVVVTREKGPQKLLLNAILFQVEGKVYKVIALQNINDVLDENEANAWQRLLSVMTHEIMNSIAPISSLANTLQSRMLNEKDAPGETLYDDLQLGIDTIKRRSEGLLRFAETYHSLNKIISLNITTVQVSRVFENLNRLMEPTLQQKNIELDIILRDASLLLRADQGLVEQMLINLLMNAMEAVKEVEEPRIVLSAEKGENDKVVIKVGDNGTGIPAELADKIFVPFYTTKKSGTGVGLSLCKQIMLMHKGKISVRSQEQRGTVFTLTFA